MNYGQFSEKALLAMSVSGTAHKECFNVRTDVSQEPSIPLFCQIQKFGLH